jgi:phosphatidylserine/phosphatidylglycerophosphate/cardiolipin synthase-like enzyme
MKAVLKGTVVFSIVIAIVLVAIAGDFLSLTHENKAPNQKSYSSQGCMVILLENRDYFTTLLKAIDNAQKEIIMSFFLFKMGKHPNNYPEILTDHLEKAAKRGMRIEIVLERSDKISSDVDQDNCKTAELLKDRGIFIYFDYPQRTTHTKVVVIDRRYTIIGSHNLTQSALKYNNELSVLIDSKPIAEKTILYIKGLHP